MFVKGEPVRAFKGWWKMPAISNEIFSDLYNGAVVLKWGYAKLLYGVHVFFKCLQNNIVT